MTDTLAPAQAVPSLEDLGVPSALVLRRSAPELTDWCQRNKYPLIVLRDCAPDWLASAPIFQHELAAEEDWYEVQRREYAIVRQAWMDEGISCLMIKSAGNRPAFPHTSDNIDVLVRPERGEAARDTLRTLGYVEIRSVEEPHKILFRKFHDGRCVSAMHVHEQVIWFVGFMDEASLWARIRVSDDDPLVNIPSPEDAVLINLAHACYENKVIKFNDVVRIHHVLETTRGDLDWAYMQRVAASRGWLDGLAFLLLVYAWIEERLFGETLIARSQLDHFERLIQDDSQIQQRLAAIRATSALDLPLDLNYWFCKRLYYRKILADPVRSSRQRMRDVAVTLIWGVRLKSRIRPQPGLLVSLSGVDGSGKTAHAEALVDALRLCELKADYLWARGGSTGLAGAASRVRRQVSGNAKVETPTDQVDNLTRRRQRLKNPLLRLAWSWMVATDQLACYALRAYLPARLGRIIVSDRYVYDAAVEMDASLPQSAHWSRFAIATMLKLAPRPDMAYILDVSPATAQQRKADEVWHADIEDERARYLDLAKRHRLQVQTNDGQFADLNDRLICDVITGYMARYETWLNALFWSNPSQKNVPDRFWQRGRTG